MTENGQRLTGERRLLILPEELRKTRLITDEYRSLQTKLHQNPDYGTTAEGYAPIISKLCDDYEVQELLDYGCGKQLLAKNLKVKHNMAVQLYDPAIDGLDDTPDPCEMVVCIDVFEHFEPTLIYNNLDELQRLTKRLGFFTVCCEPAMKTLEDGRNAHLIVQPPEWWLPKIMERFDLHTFQKRPDGFLVLVMAKNIESN